MIKYWWLNALAFLLNSLLFIFILFPVCLWWANPNNAVLGNFLLCLMWDNTHLCPRWLHPGCFPPVPRTAWRDWGRVFFHTAFLQPPAESPRAQGLKATLDTWHHWTELSIKFQSSDFAQGFERSPYWTSLTPSFLIVEGRLIECSLNIGKI